MKSQTQGNGFRTAARLALPAILSAAALLLPGTARAQQGPYLGIHGGVNDLHGWSHRVDFGAGISSGGSLSLNSREHWGLMAGAESGLNRGEIEYAQGSFRISGVTLASVPAPEDGNGTYRTLTANAYRRVEFSAADSLYLGAGVGVGWVKVGALPPLRGCDCYREASENGFAWQLRAGVEHSFGNAGRMFLQYTFIRLPSARSGGTPSVKYAEKDVNAVTVGYRKNF